MANKQIIKECPLIWIADATFQSKLQQGSFVSNGYGCCTEERCAMWNEKANRCGLICPIPQEVNHE